MFDALLFEQRLSCSSHISFRLRQVIPEQQTAKSTKRKVENDLDRDSIEVEGIDMIKRHV